MWTACPPAIVLTRQLKRGLMIQNQILVSDDGDEERMTERKSPTAVLREGPRALSAEQVGEIEESGLADVLHIDINDVIEYVHQDLKSLPDFRTLYRRYLKQRWDVYDLDFTQDAIEWKEKMTADERQSFMAVASGFHHGERQVEIELPVFMIGASEDEKLHIAAQIEDEARHTVFFDRFYREVVGLQGHDIMDILDASFPWVSETFVGPFGLLAYQADEVRRNPYDERARVRYGTTYFLWVEGVLALSVMKVTLSYARWRGFLPKEWANTVRDALTAGPPEQARAGKLQEYWDFFDRVKGEYPASWALGCRNLPAGCGGSPAYLSAVLHDDLLLRGMPRRHRRCPGPLPGARHALTVLPGGPGRAPAPALPACPQEMIMIRTALVTGGASGLGAASAARLRAEGLTVTTLDIDGQPDVVADVTDEAALRRLASEIGRVDVLINSAGIVGANKPLLETTAEQWRHVFDVNVLGTVAAMRAFVPGMCERGWGRVVNFASMAGKDGNPDLSIYSASKAAVIGLTKSAGKELATSGVLVNAIAPAVIATPMNDSTSRTCSRI